MWAPQSEIEPVAPALEDKVFNHWITREVPILYFLNSSFLLLLIQERNQQVSGGINAVKQKSGVWLNITWKKVKASVIQSCPTLYDPMDCSPPGSSVHGILQARILEWIAIPFSRGSSHPRDQTLISCITARFFTIWATGKSKIWNASWVCMSFLHREKFMVIFKSLFPYIFCFSPAVFNTITLIFSNLIIISDNDFLWV